MPTYEYECEACGHTFEKFQSIKARPLKTCPSCGKRKVRRLLGTGGAVIFKGSGFYATDYRSSSYHRDAKKAKSDGEGGSGSKGGKGSGGACTKDASASCGGCRKQSGTCPNE